MLTARLWWLYLRGRRLPTYAVGCLALLGLSVALPAQAQVWTRTVEADPWQVYWSLAGGLVPVLLDSSHDFMERSLPTPLTTRRAAVVASAAPVAGTAILLAAAIDGRPALGALLAAASAAGVAMLLSSLIGPPRAIVVTLVLVLLTWVFGMSEVGYQVRPWAVLLRAPSPPTVLCAVLLGLGGAALWVRRGS